MDHLIILIAHHGYLVIFLVVLAEALDIPLPASLAMIAGGGRSCFRRSSRTRGFLR